MAFIAAAGPSSTLVPPAQPQAATLKNAPSPTAQTGHALSSTAVTNAPIQPYQTDPKLLRNYSAGIHEKYGYSPSPAYLQAEANILASMRYLPDEADKVTAADKTLYQDTTAGFKYLPPTGSTPLSNWTWSSEANYYPSSWGTDQTTWTGPEHVDWIHRTLRKLADNANLIRYVTLTKAYAQQCYAVQPIALNTEPFTEAFDNGIGTYAWCPLYHLLLVRNSSMQSTIRDISSEGLWRNSVSHVAQFTMSDFDITGLPLGHPDINSLVTAKGQAGFPVTTGVQLGYSFSKLLYDWQEWVPATRKLKIKATHKAVLEGFSDATSWASSVWGTGFWSMSHGLMGHEVMGHGYGSNHHGSGEPAELIADAALHGYSSAYRDVSYGYFNDALGNCWSQYASNWKRAAKLLLLDETMDFHGNLWNASGFADVRYDRT